MGSPTRLHLNQSTLGDIGDHNSVNMRGNSIIGPSEKSLQDAIRCMSLWRAYSAYERTVNVEADLQDGTSVAVSHLCLLIRDQYQNDDLAVENQRN